MYLRDGGGGWNFREAIQLAGSKEEWVELYLHTHRTPPCTLTLHSPDTHPPPTRTPTFHPPAETPQGEAEATVGVEADGDLPGRVQLTLQLDGAAQGAGGRM